MPPRLAIKGTAAPYGAMPVFDVNVSAPFAGVTVAGADGDPVPTLFVAVTVQEYVTLLDRPLTVMGDVGAVAENAAGLHAAV